MTLVRQKRPSRLRLALAMTDGFELLVLAFAFAGFVLFAIFLASLFACASRPEPSAAESRAAGAYERELLACVDEAGTRAESQACRARVDCRWGQGACWEGGRP